MKNYSVYKHTSPSGKIYIGITSQEPKKRWANGLSYRHQRYLSTAIKKYGWDNIKHEVLFENLTKEQAEQKEIELIAFYKSNDRRYGYNIENGGKAKGRCSEETKKRISEAQKGHKPYVLALKRALEVNTGKHCSAETRRKISEAQKGKIIPLEVRLKISKAHKGKKLSQEHKEKISREVKKSWTEEKRKKISERFKGKNNVNYGKVFTEEEIINLQMKNRGANSVRSKKVGQYDLQGNLIRTFDSAREAGRNGYSYAGVSGVCRGEHKTHKGYVWKYI